MIASDATAFAAFETGAPAVGLLGISDVSQAQATSSLKVFSRATQNFYFLAMNVTDPVLKNMDLRKAIRSAIDVPGIISAAYKGEYEAAYGIIPPSMSVGYWADAPHYNQDIPLAKSYLASSGARQGDSQAGCAERPDRRGRRPDHRVQPRRRSGIDVTLEPTNSATFYAIPGTGRRRPSPAARLRVRTSPSRTRTGRSSGGPARRWVSGTGATGATRSSPRM